MIYCIIAGWVVAMGRIFFETGGKVDCSVMGLRIGSWMSFQPSKKWWRSGSNAVCRAVQVSKQCYCKCFSFMNFTLYQWDPKHLCFDPSGLNSAPNYICSNTSEILCLFHHKPLALPNPALPRKLLQWDFCLFLCKLQTASNTFEGLVTPWWSRCSVAGTSMATDIF